MKKLTGLLLLPAFGVALNASPAVAGDQIVTRSQVVRFADLNLATDEGAQTLYKRIKLAASQVCDGADSRFGYSEYRKCMTRAVDDAVAKVNRPTLQLVHESRKAPRVG
jgi:UrcA family protein